jgi:hypothetical protein
MLGYLVANKMTIVGGAALEKIHFYGSCFLFTLFLGTLLIQVLSIPLEALSCFLPVIFYVICKGSRWHELRQHRARVQAFVTRKDDLTGQEAYQVVEWLFKMVHKLDSAAAGNGEDGACLSAEERKQLALIS